MGGAVADGFFGEEGLLAEAVGDFGELALVGADGGEVVGLADEIEGAEGFPDLFVARGDNGNFGACGYVRTWSHEESADAAGDGRAKFEGSQLVLGRFDGGVDQKLYDQAALVDGGSYLI
jgi:hypothetical protein